MLSFRSYRDFHGPPGRYGAIEVAVAALAAAALGVACGSLGNDLSAGTPPSPDGGSPDAQPGEGGSLDSGSDGPAPVPTTALFVQGSRSLPGVRFCWAKGGVVAGALPFPSDGDAPASNYPGVALGGVVSMGDATQLVGDDVTLYAIDAENLARLELGQSSPSTCDALVCGTGSQPEPCLRYNLDYWPVAKGAAGGLRANLDNVVALSGCLPTAIDADASAAVCGPAWTAVDGNLHADVLQLLRTTSIGPAMSVQAAQLSPGLTALEGDGGTVVSFGAQGGADASQVAILAGEGDLAAPSVVSVGSDLSVYGQLGFAVDVAGYDGGAGHLWMSLAESLQLVDPTEDPTQFFGRHATYLVAVLGDPAASHAFGPALGDAGYTGLGLHVLVVAAPSPEGGASDAGDL
jgi:hypothetical protein